MTNEMIRPMLKVLMRATMTLGTRSGRREPEGGGGFHRTTAVEPVQRTQ